MKPRPWFATVAAFAWPVWARNRALFTAGSAMLVVFVALERTADQVMSHLLVAWYLILALVLAVTPVGLYLTGLGPARSGVPQRALTYPVRTRDLVGIPLVLGCSVFLAAWTLFATTAAATFGQQIPILAIALGGVAAICWMQSLGWLAAALGSWCVLPELALIMIWFVGAQPVFPEGPSLRAFLFLFVTVASVSVTAWASPYARNGIPLAWRERRLRAQKNHLDVPTLPPFRSALLAQAWLERGRLQANLLAVPAFVCFFLLMILSMGALVPGMPLMALGIGDIHVQDSATTLLSQLPTVLITPMILALSFDLLGGPPKAGSKLAGQHRTFPTARPISAAEIAAAKMWVLAKSAALQALIIVIAIASVFTQPASEHGVTRPLAILLAGHLPGGATLFSLACALSLVVVAFTLRLPTPFTYTKLTFLRYGVVAVYIAIEFKLMNLRTMLTGSPSLLRYMYHTTPEGVVGMLHRIFIGGWLFLAARAVFTAIAVALLCKRRLISGTTLLRGFGIWLAVALGLILAFRETLPAASVSTGAIVLTILLILPANRILWLILNLDSARHA